MSEKPILFNYDIEKKKELAIILARDGDSIKDVLSQLVDDYIKTHKDGNSQHLLTSWQDDVSFEGFAGMAVSLDKKKQWMNSNIRTKKEFKSLFWHLQEWSTQLERKGFGI